MNIKSIILKTYLLTILFIFSLNIFGQNNKTLLTSKIRVLIQTKAIGCNLKGKKCSVYFNNSEKTLDIYNNQIPLNDVKVNYEFIQNREFKHWVNFTCRDGFCMRTVTNQEMQEFSIPFRNRQDCYQLIEAIGNLKETF